MHCFRRYHALNNNSLIYHGPSSGRASPFRGICARAQRRSGTRPRPHVFRGPTPTSQFLIQHASSASSKSPGASSLSFLHHHPATPIHALSPAANAAPRSLHVACRCDLPPEQAPLSQLPRFRATRLTSPNCFAATRSSSLVGWRHSRAPRAFPTLPIIPSARRQFLHGAGRPRTTCFRIEGGARKSRGSIEGVEETMGEPGGCP